MLECRLTLYGRKISSEKLLHDKSDRGPTLTWTPKRFPNPSRSGPPLSPYRQTSFTVYHENQFINWFIFKTIHLRLAIKRKAWQKCTITYRSFLDYDWLLIVRFFRNPHLLQCPRRLLPTLYFPLAIRKLSQFFLELVASSSGSNVWVWCMIKWFHTITLIYTTFVKKKKSQTFEKLDKWKIKTHCYNGNVVKIIFHRKTTSSCPSFIGKPGWHGVSYITSSFSY